MLFSQFRDRITSVGLVHNRAPWGIGCQSPFHQLCVLCITTTPESQISPRQYHNFYSQFGVTSVTTLDFTCSKKVQFCVCVCVWVSDKFFMYIVHCSAIYFPMSVLSSEVTCCFPGEDMHPHTYTGCWVSCIIQKTMTCNYFFNVKQKSNKCVCYRLFFSWWIAGWHYVMRVSHTFWCLLPFPHSSS